MSASKLAAEMMQLAKLGFNIIDYMHLALGVIGKFTIISTHIE